MADPSANLRAALEKRRHAKKACNSRNFVTTNENNDIGRLHGKNQFVTRVTDGGSEGVRLQGYKPAAADRVTGNSKDNQPLSAAGYTVTRLHAFGAPRADLTGESTENPVDGPVTLDEVLQAIEVSIEWFEQERGCSRPVAEASALALVRGCLLNDPRLVPAQWNTTRCLICNDPGTPSRILAPFCTPIPDRHLWMHLEPCHAEHRRRQAAKADALLARTQRRARE